nr:hypothetical protein [Desulfobacula sp.]
MDVDPGFFPDQLGHFARTLVHSAPEYPAQQIKPAFGKLWGNGSQSCPD